MMRDIALKVEQGTRLNDQEALWLFKHAPLNELGRLANTVNLRKNGLAVFYNVNRHINPTNICALSCKFCAYSKKIGEDGSYAYDIDEMIAKAGEAVAQGATELHMVGGLHPRWGFQRYVDMIAAMHQAYPQVHLKAFTAVELDWMARKARKTIAEVMTELRAAGLGSFPGGGAEIFHPDIRDQICETKVSGEQWIDTHRTAHQLGMRSNCTMLYGHIESFEHRVDHMRRLRELQDETGGFNVFIPLAFQPFQNEMGIDRYTFGADDLRTIGIARLYLDNFRHIKSYWVMLGQDVAQLALQFGANDLDGTVLEEKISRAAGGRAGMIMTRSNLEMLIRRSGRIPVERTTLYEPVRSDDRINMAPVTRESLSETLSDRLDLLEAGVPLTPSDLWVTAKQSSLHAITMALDHTQKTAKGSRSMTRSLQINVDDTTLPETCVQLVNNQASRQTMHNEQESPVIVLNTEKLRNMVDLTSIVKACHDLEPRYQVIISGLKALFSSAKTAGKRLSEHLVDLRLNGLNLIEEMSTDSDLSADDRWTLFESAKLTDIAVLPCLTLKDNGTELDWSKWADDVTEMRSRLSRDQAVFAVSLRSHADSLIMPGEYLKALALTRLYLPEHIQLWTPTPGIPSLTPMQGLGAGKSQKPMMKLLSIVPMFGSSSLGFVPENELSMTHIMEELRASGFEPQLSDVRLNHINAPDALQQRIASLRHVPNILQAH